MKPKSKLQKLVVSLSEKLPAITHKQKQYAYDNCFDAYYTRSRKTLFCLECGYSWKETSSFFTAVAGCQCPSCNKELKETKRYKWPSSTVNEYYGILTTKGDMQVLRIFYVSKIMKKHEKPRYFITEAIQHWINDSGEITSMSLDVYGLSYYYDSWVLSSELQVRPKHWHESLRATITPYKIYPHRSILPTLKRNGFKGHFYGILHHKLFSLLLSDTYAETLVKAGQYSMLKHYSSTTLKQDFLAKYWNSIKICMRAGYLISDASIWCDYIDLLAYFRKDLRNAKYVCPENLKHAHDRLVSKKREMERKKKVEQIKKEMQESQLEYEKQKGCFFGLQYQEGELTIKVLESVEEFMLEGDELGHCVFVNEYYNKPNSLVLSARIDDKPVETIEVSLSNLDILQARGMGNKPTQYHDRILNAMNKVLPEISNRKRLFTETETSKQLIPEIEIIKRLIA